MFNIFQFFKDLFKPWFPTTHVIVEAPKAQIMGVNSTIVHQQVMTSTWQPFNKQPYDNQAIYFEEDDCVTESGIHSAETQIQQQLSIPGLVPDFVKQGLKDLKLINSQGFVDISVRFCASVNGTTPDGLRVEDFWTSLKNDGFVPKAVYPDPDGVFNRNQFYVEPGLKMRAFAKAFRQLFDIDNEWVVTGNCGQANLELLKQAIQQAPLQIAGPSCTRDSQGIQYPCNSCVCQHARLINWIDEYFEILDSEGPPFIKKASLDYPMPWVMKGLVTIKKIDEPTLKGLVDSINQSVA